MSSDVQSAYALAVPAFDDLAAAAGKPTFSGTVVALQQAQTELEQANTNLHDMTVDRDSWKQRFQELNAQIDAAQAQVSGVSTPTGDQLSGG